MFAILPASPITFFIVLFAYLVVPWYTYLTFAPASKKLAIRLAAGTMAWGALMAVIVLFEVDGKTGLPGPFILLANLLIPVITAIALGPKIRRLRLSQHTLVGLQVFRVIGGVFLIEMVRGVIPGIFAHPAGWGDLLTGVVALWVVWRYRGQAIPRSAVIAVAVLGMVDFASAFFFGIGSSATPLQIFTPEIPNLTGQFPTGLIPYFLVPYAFSFHILSLFSLGTKSKHES